MRSKGLGVSSRQMPQVASWHSQPSWRACWSFPPPCPKTLQQAVTRIGTMCRLEQSDDTNARIAELAIASTAKQEDYIIGSGDLLSVEVFDVAN
jgi:hypothetical protein